MGQSQRGFHATCWRSFALIDLPPSDGAAYGRWTDRLAEAFIDFAGLPRDGDLLDVGCGTSALAIALAKRWPTRCVVGIDLAEPFISYARARRAGITALRGR